jgi:protein-S-isoprenylcysteine O-methyltransferase Ste14
MLRTIMPTGYLLISLVAMVALRSIVPGATFVPPPWNLLGIAPLAFGVWINLAADKAIHQAQTTVKPFEEPEALIVDGVYGVSRNPMYMGFVMILVGVALLLGVWPPLIVLIGFVILIQAVFIRAEEQNLDRKFGQAWLKYKRTVRRWV